LNRSVYKNKRDVHLSLFNYIDTNVVYEKIDYEYFISNGKYRNTNYCLLRFYPNGNFNEFYVPRNTTDLNIVDLDPNYRGTRGVYFMLDNKIRFEHFAPTSELGTIGKQRGHILVRGDTLILNTEKPAAFSEVFVRKILPKNLLRYNADW
jgi:hypothetical protein